MGDYSNNAGVLRAYRFHKHFQFDNRKYQTYSPWECNMLIEKVYMYIYIILKIIFLKTGKFLKFLLGGVYNLLI